MCRLGCEVAPRVWECPRILGFWVHDKPRNFGELQLGLPHHFSLFFHVFSTLAGSLQPMHRRILQGRSLVFPTFIYIIWTWVIAAYP